MFPISSVLINFLIFIAIGFGLRRKNLQFKGWPTFFKIVLLGGLSWLVLAALGYLFTPPFFDHAESNIASVAANWLQGHSIYTVLDSAEQYSLLYGPWPYLMSALFESFGSQALFWSKLPGVLNLSVVLICFVVLLKKEGVSKVNSVFTIGLLALGLLGFYNISYWNRPDSYIMAAVFLTVLSIEFSSRLSPWFVYVSVGLLAGIATNCKLHAVIYFLPICVYFLEVKKQRFDILKTFVALIVYAAVFIGPFLLPQVGGENYFSWLKLASMHGFVFNDKAANDEKS